jgi:hypothetical protein
MKTKSKMENKGFVIQKRITECLCADQKKLEYSVHPDEDFGQVFQDLTEDYRSGQCDHGEPWEHDAVCQLCGSNITIRRWFVVTDRKVKNED